MQPIQDLLNRIKWDAEFGAGQFRVGYYDRVSEQVIEVSLSHLRFSPDDHFAFELVDEDGNCHQVPLHRIRDVYRNGELIWHRAGEGAR